MTDAANIAPARRVSFTVTGYLRGGLTLVTAGPLGIGLLAWMLTGAAKGGSHG